MKNFLFIISAPAGTGKSTLVDQVIASLDGKAKQSCSMTTRPPREGEVDGSSYYFVDLDTFHKAIKEDKFLEYAHVFGHYYGTLKEQIDSILRTSHAILVIDTQGAMKVAKARKDAVLIFIQPPSFDELTRRLLDRGTEDEQEQLLRLERAKKELEMAKYYDYQVVNRDLDQAVKELKRIIVAEEKKRREDGQKSNE